MEEARHNKSFNLANFFAVGFFKIAYHNNVQEADTAEEWAQLRRLELTNLFIEKGCAPDIAPRGAAAAGHPVASRQAVIEKALRDHR